MKGFTQVDDASLLSSLHALVRANREGTSKIVAHLAEVDERRLHAVRGYPSLFAYCLQELRFSEDEACRRIDAARLVRRFPSILPMLESGELSLSVLGLLKHRLVEENAEAVLAGVSRKSARDAKEWLAAKFPQPDLPDAIRKLPAKRENTATIAHSDPPPVLPAPGGAPAVHGDPTAPDSHASSSATLATAASTCRGRCTPARHAFVAARRMAETGTSGATLRRALRRDAHHRQGGT